MTLVEYNLLLRGWNEAHRRDGDDLEPPTPEMWEAEQRRILANPRLTMAGSC